uniref:Cleavage and polyadenylation specificity factor subunit 2 n=1 Tax=Tetraselmis sp. GSL018 TaxID=582737 RepID=A0A061R5T7_9CHLO
MDDRGIFKLTPLSGAMGHSPRCYVLQIGERHILLDCGWDECFTRDIVEPLKEWAPKVDAVLVSHCSLAHLGVLPYAVGKLGLNAPIYGTLPIQKMGSLLMYDQCLSRLHDPSWDLFDLDDVDAVFNNLHTVRFLERTRLTGKCEGITITPHCAGHTLGGAVWCISACGEDIVYAIDYNHRRERHLNGTSLQSAFSRPAAMITGAYNVTATPFDRQARDDKLKDLIISTLRGDGNVLLPVDSAGRALELLLMLDSHWTDRRIVYPLIFMNHQAYNVVEFAKSQLEWMSDALSSKFSRSRDHPNPFETRCLKLMHDTSELAALPPGPVVVVATSPSLEAGLSRELFAKWAPRSRNCIIFSERADPHTVAGMVQASAKGPPLELKIVLSKRVPLEGEELAAFQAEQERKRQEEREAEAVIEVDQEQQSVSRSSSVVSQGLLRAGSLRKQGAVSRELVLELEDGDTGKQVLIDFRRGGPPEDAAAAMFPDDGPPDVEWDDFGCTLDDNIASLRQRANESAETDVIMTSPEDEEEVHPTKVETKEVDVEVRCRIHTLDYEGRADGRSMRSIVTRIAPRQLAVLNGSQEETQHMLKVCSNELRPWRTVCRAPKLQETVDLSPSYPTRKAEIANSLYAALKFRQHGNSRFCWLSGEVMADEEGMPVLVKEPPGKLGGSSSGSVFIGDVRLSAVKQALAEAGVQAEFSGGVLVCSSNVMVRRGSEDGELVLEGPLCSDYYKIRGVVYGQYHIC